MHFPSTGRTALLLAHPGHELVVHAFVERVRPLVAVLTDGSGRRAQSRLAETTAVLQRADAEVSGFYGRATDQQCYGALLRGDCEAFIGFAEELAATLTDHAIDVAAGDASEGWNPIHDIWRCVVNAAVELASHRLGRDILNLDFLLFGSHAAAAEACRHPSLVLRLDGSAYERKLHAGEAYRELHGEVQAAMSGSTAALVGSPRLSAELDRRLNGLNAQSYRIELLREVDPHASPTHRERRVYELYGEMMVAAGRYREAIVYERHLAPVETALREHVVRETRSRSVCAYSSLPTT